MKYKIWILTLIWFCSLRAQNTNLLGHFSYTNAYHDPTEINDCWGYEKNGKKYALVGLKNPGAFSILDISDPQNINEVYYLQGPNSTWRDVKVYKEYAYVVNEENGGLDIFDLTNIDIGMVQHSQAPVNFTRAHNIFIDTAAAHLLVIGSNIGNGGVLIYDISQPLSPDSIGNLNLFYVHDAFKRNDTIWTANVLDGHFALYHFDGGNSHLLGLQTTTSIFTHNIWPDDSGDFVFTTDEISGAYVEAYNVKDNANYELCSKVRSSAFDLTVPHNTYYLNGFLYTSFYGDGLRVFDAEDPYNLIESAYYDTYSGNSNSYDGAWGIYPFGGGDTLIISDQNSGLWVLEHQRIRARKLNIQFKDALSLQSIQNLKTRVLKTDLIRFTDGLGRVKTGVDTSFIALEIERIGYLKDTLEIPLNGDLDTTIYLNPLNDALYTFQYRIIDKESKLPIPNAQLRLKNEWLDSVYVTDLNGNVEINGLVSQLYDITFGAWGYQDFCLALFPTEDRNFTVELSPGYEWSFEFDFNAFSPQKNGDWETSSMKGANFPNVNNPTIRPYFDTQDCGKRAVVTQFGSINLDQHQLNLGESSYFKTPLIQTANDFESTLRFQVYWIQMMDQVGEKDSLKIYKLSEGDTSLLSVFTTEYYELLDSLELEWQHYELSYIVDGKPYQLLIEYQKSNLNFRSEIYLDQFIWTTKSRKSGNSNAIIFPNPYTINDDLYLGINEVGAYQFDLFDLKGKKIFSQATLKSTKDWDIIDLSQEIAAGYYIYRLEMNGTVYDGKLIIR